MWSGRGQLRGLPLCGSSALILKNCGTERRRDGNNDSAKLQKKCHMINGGGEVQTWGAFIWVFQHTISIYKGQINYAVRILHENCQFDLYAYSNGPCQTDIQRN